MIENNNCGDEHWTSAKKNKTWGKTTQRIIPNGTTTPANNRTKIAKKQNNFPDVAFHRFMDTEIRQNQTVKTVAEKILGCSLNRRYKPPAWLRRPFPMQHLHSTLVQSPTKAGLMHPQYSNMFKQSILDVIEMIQTCAMRPKNNELFGNTRVLFASKWHQTVWRHFHVALHIQFLLVSFPNQTYNSQFGSIWQNPACESTIHAKLWSFQANWLLNSCLCNSNVPCLPETKAWLARQNLGQGALQCNNPETASSTVLQHVSQLFCHSIKLQNIWEFCTISPTTQKKLRERSWHFKSRITKSNGSCTKQPEQQPKSWFYHDN